MRIAPGFLIMAALLASQCNADTAVAVSSANTATTPSADDEEPNDFGSVVKKIRFVHGNLTGTLVVAVDPDSLHELSKEELASMDTQKMLDIKEASELVPGKGEERRWIYSNLPFFQNFLLKFSSKVDVAKLAKFLERRPKKNT
uniref:RxLR effector protein n=2 Tax=Peronospora matthiolae TaxID=2874970 RepID=A0AAV1VJV5_9STRA